LSTALSKASSRSSLWVHRHAEIERARVDLRLTALDHAGLRERTDTARNRGGGERDAFGELHLAQARILQQRDQNSPIERVQGFSLAFVRVLAI
jgi:hypothetical protein